MKQKTDKANDLLAVVAAALEADSLLEGVRRLGVAVSGGADSVALLSLLAPVCRTRGIALMALHLNHGLRGAASDDDEAFVRALCAKLGVTCEVGRAGGLADARPKRRGACQSLEMAARAARQEFFKRAARAHGLDAVAVAHHRDDAAETVLLRLMRGAGAAGLSGMRPKTGVAGLTVIRPLLGLSRQELHAWLRLRKQTWREDESNADLSILRNRVRRSALPYLETRFGARVACGLARSADLLREDDAVLEGLAATARARIQEGGELVVSRLLSEPEALQRRVVYRWLLEQGDGGAAAFETVRRVLRGVCTGKRWQFLAGGGVRIGCRAGRLSLASDLPSPPEVAERGLRMLRRNGSVTFGGVRVTVRRTTGIVRGTGPAGMLPAQCTLSAEALRGKRLAIRFRRPGDRIAPLGLSGSRKVQDVLTDAKVSADQRDAVPLLVCGGDVAWIPGYRVAARYAVPGPAAPSWLVTVEKESPACGGDEAVPH